MTATRHTHHVLAGLGAFVAMQSVALPTARANCAIYEYHPETDEEAGTVVICADQQECSGGDVMLRENVETGEVVEIRGACREDEWESCWIDECVPAGTYRYGTVEPLRFGCGFRSLFAEVEVSTTAESCTRTAGSEAKPYEDGAPWGDESDEDCVSGFGCSAASDASRVSFPAFTVVGLVGLALLVRRGLGR